MNGFKVICVDPGLCRELTVGRIARVFEDKLYFQGSEFQVYYKPGGSFFLKILTI